MAAKVETNYIRNVITRQLAQLKKYEKKRLTAESTHQLRVAARRLDTSLDVFRQFFPKRKVKAWRRNLRSLLKTLGKDRDMDVLLNFLKEREDPTLDQAIKILQRKKRRLHQISIECIGTFWKSGTPAQVSEELERLAKRDIRHLDRKLRKLCRRVVLKRLEALGDYRKFADKPGRTDKLHEMRLTFKRLRYSMEAFGPLYEDRLTRFIKYCSDLQTHLGDVHDREIWLEDRDLKSLSKVLKSLKQKSYREFCAVWRETRKKRIWDRLSQVVEA